MCIRDRYYYRYTAIFLNYKGDSANPSEIGQHDIGISVYNGDPHQFMRQEASKYERLKKYLDRVGLRITLLFFHRGDITSRKQLTTSAISVNEHEYIIFLD